MLVTWILMYSVHIINSPRIGLSMFRCSFAESYCVFCCDFLCSKFFYRLLDIFLFSVDDLRRIKIVDTATSQDGPHFVWRLKYPVLLAWFLKRHSIFFKLVFLLAWSKAASNLAKKRRVIRCRATERKSVLVSET